jgi:hypothetical protein
MSSCAEFGLFLGQTQSKDLRLLFNELLTGHTS